MGPVPTNNIMGLIGVVSSFLRASLIIGTSRYERPTTVHTRKKTLVEALGLLGASTRPDISLTADETFDSYHVLSYPKGRTSLSRVLSPYLSPSLTTIGDDHLLAVLS